MSAATRSELAAFQPSKQAQMHTQDLQATDQQLAQHATAGNGTQDPLTVICNGNYGLYLVARRAVQCFCSHCKSSTKRDPNGDSCAISPTEYERHSGMPTAKKWRQSIRVAHEGEPDMPLGRWLEQHGLLSSNAPSSSSLPMHNSLQQQMASTRGRSGSPAAVSAGSYRQHNGRQRSSPQQQGADDMDIDQAPAAQAACTTSQWNTQPCVNPVTAAEAASNALKVAAAVAAGLPIDVRGPVEVIQPLVAAGRFEGAAPATARCASSLEQMHHQDKQSAASTAVAAEEAAALQAAAEAEAAAADAEGRVFKQQKQGLSAVPKLLEIPCTDVSAAALRGACGPVVLEEAAAAAARGDDSLWMRSPVRKTPRGCSRLLAEMAGVLPPGAAGGAARSAEDRSTAVVKLLGEALSAHSAVTRQRGAAAVAESETAGADGADQLLARQAAGPNEASVHVDDEQQQRRQQVELDCVDEDGEEEPGIAVGLQHQAEVPDLQLLPPMNAVEALLELKKAGTPGPSEHEALAIAIEEKARADLLPRDAVEDVWERSTGLALERAQRQRKPPGWQTGFIDPLKPQGQSGPNAMSAANEPGAVSTIPHGSGDDGSDEGRPTHSSRKRGSREEPQHQHQDDWHQHPRHALLPPCQFYCPHGLLVTYQPQLLPLPQQQLDQDAREQLGKRQRCSTSLIAAAAVSGAVSFQTWARRWSVDGKGLQVPGVDSGSNQLCCSDPGCIRNNPAMAAAAAACSLCASGVPAGWGCGSGLGLTRGPAGPELLSWLLLTPAAASTGNESPTSTDVPEQQQTQVRQQDELHQGGSAAAAAGEGGGEVIRQPQADVAATGASSELLKSASPDTAAAVSDASSGDAEDDMAVDAAAAIQTVTPSAGKDTKGCPAAVVSTAQEAGTTQLHMMACPEAAPADLAQKLPTSLEEPWAAEPAGGPAGESQPANSSAVAAEAHVANATASEASQPAVGTAPAAVDTRGVVEVRIVLDGCVFIGQLQEVGRLDLARARISAAQDPIWLIDSHEPPAPGTKCSLCHKPETPGCHSDQASAVASCGMSSRGLGPLMPVAMAGGSATSPAAVATSSGQDEQQQEGCGVSWVHRQCALWSPEVYPDKRGSLMFLPNAVRRGRATRCSQCGLKGATLKCAERCCMLHFHLECARDAGCTLIPEPYTIACPFHEPVKPPLPGPAVHQGHQPLAAPSAELLLPEHLSLRCKTTVERAHRGGEAADWGSAGTVQHMSPHGSPVRRGTAAGASRRTHRQQPGSRAGSPWDTDGRTFFMAADRERDHFYSGGSYISDGTPHVAGGHGNGLCSEGAGAAVGDELDGQREEELGAAMLLSGFKRTWNGQSRLQRQSSRQEFGDHDRMRRQQQQQAPGSPDIRSHRATPDLTPRAAAAAAARASSRGTSGGARRASSRPGGSAVRCTAAHQLHDSRGRFMSHAQAAALGLLQRHSAGGRDDAGATPAGSAIADAADSGADTCGTPGYSTGPDADGALSDASAGTPPVSDMDLGGTTGQPGRAGRCAVCVIQRKGKCGTESAPKKCLRRQLQQQQKQRAAAAAAAARAAAAAAAAAAESGGHPAAVPAGALTAATGVPASIAAAAEFQAAAAAAAVATSTAARRPVAAPAVEALPQTPAAAVAAAAAEAAA